MPIETVLKNVFTTVGEGPHWDEDTKMLYVVDIFANGVSRWNSTTGEVQSIKLDATIGFVTPTTKGDVIIGLGNTFSRLDWESKRVNVIQKVVQDEEIQFNDGKCDAKGRIWAGTTKFDMSSGKQELVKEQGSLYCLHTDGSVSKHLDNLNISNGMAWSDDNKTMYFVDSVPGTVFAFDFDIEKATISNQRIIFKCEPEPFNKLGSPDGMTIDQEGNLWIACFFGGRIIKIDPKAGRIVNTYHMPAMRPSSCCFGGSDYADLFVTSSCLQCPEEELAKCPLSGSVFKITDLGAKGYPLVKYNG